MDKQISHLITESCKKYGIDYKSINPNYVTFSNDAQLLGQLYRDLLEIVDKLQEIGERHNIEGLKKILSKDIYDLCNIDHDLIHLANVIREEKKC